MEHETAPSVFYGSGKRKTPTLIKKNGGGKTQQHSLTISVSLLTLITFPDHKNLLDNSSFSLLTRGAPETVTL